MKTLKLLTFLIFLQVSVNAQFHYGISVGGGIWWAKFKESSTNTFNNINYQNKYTKTIKSNFCIEYNFKNNFGLESGLNYSFLQSNEGYLIDENDAGIFEMDNRHDYQEYAIPLKINYTYKKIIPYAGFIFAERNYWHSKEMYAYNLINFTTGIQFKLSKSIRTAINFETSMSKEFYSSVYEDILNTGAYMEKSYFWRSRSLTISLLYFFK